LQPGGPGERYFAPAPRGIFSAVRNAYRPVSVFGEFGERGGVGEGEVIIVLILHESGELSYFSF
jgi:hypothetical protein